MDIEVKNPKAAEDACNVILNLAKQTEDQIDSLESSLRKINERWESTGRDKESYVAELEKQIQNLRIMEKGMSDLAVTIRNYAQNISTTSSSTM